MNCAITFLSLLLFAYRTEAAITILEPQEVIDEFAREDLPPKIDVSFAEFGHIPYRASITGMVYYDSANPLGCNRIDNLSLFTETADLTSIPQESNPEEDGSSSTDSLQQWPPTPLPGFNETQGLGT